MKEAFYDIKEDYFKKLQDSQLKRVQDLPPAKWGR